MRLAIVDDSFLNRKTLKEKLLPYAEVELVLEAENGADYLEKLKELAPAQRPQIVLMDLEMPLLDGISAISISKVKYPELKFIVLTIYEATDRIFEAIKAGANGYLLKEDKAVNIVEALESVLNYDNIPMSPAIARSAMRLLCEENRPNITPSESQLLSDREMDVLKLMVKGHRYSDIAAQLFISPNTVRTHVNNVYKKLHLSSKSEMMELARKNNWL